MRSLSLGRGASTASARPRPGGRRALSGAAALAVVAGAVFVGGASPATAAVPGWASEEGGSTVRATATEREGAAFYHDSVDPEGQFGLTNDSGVSWVADPSSETALTDATVTGIRDGEAPLTFKGREVSADDESVLSWNAHIQGALTDHDVWLTQDVTTDTPMSEAVGVNDGRGDYGTASAPSAPTLHPHDSAIVEAWNGHAQSSMQTWVTDTFGDASYTGSTTGDDVLTGTAAERALAYAQAGPPTQLHWAHYSMETGSPVIELENTLNSGPGALELPRHSQNGYVDADKNQTVYFQAQNDAGEPVPGAIFQVETSGSNSYGGDSGNRAYERGDITTDFPASDRTINTVVANADGMVAVPFDAVKVTSMYDISGEPIEGGPPGGGSHDAVHSEKAVEVRVIDPCYTAATFIDSAGTESLGVVSICDPAGSELSLTHTHYVEHPFIPTDPPTEPTEPPTYDPATPVKPEIVPAEQCGVWDTVETVPAEGIWYTSPIETEILGDDGTVIGKEVTIRANPNAGYEIPEDVTRSWTLTIDAPEPCTTPVTPVAPELIPAEVCGVEATVTTPETEGVSYAQNREGSTVTVVASPLEGYEFAEGTTSEWTFEIPAVEACEEPATPVTPVAPELIPAEVCGVEATVTTPETEGVSYVQTREENVVTVVASPLEGYEFAEGTTSEWTFEIPAVEDCLTPATPIAPELIPAEECGVEATVDVTETEGVTYTQNREGDTVTVTAEPQAGYEFAEGTTSEWEITIPAVEECATPPAPTEPPNCEPTEPSAPAEPTEPTTPAGEDCEEAPAPADPEDPQAPAESPEAPADPGQKPGPTVQTGGSAERSMTPFALAGGLLAAAMGAALFGRKRRA